MIFILGGNGFVGSALVRYCRHNNIDHQIISRENYNNFIGKPCEIFINANGNSKMYLANQNPLEDFDASVRSVKQSLINFPTEYYIYLSSCDVYPDQSSPAITKEDIFFEHSKQRTYGFHKYLAEQCVQQSAKKWLILRLGGLIGPNLMKNPLFDILNDQPLWVDVNSEMQFINTDDCAQIIFKLIEKKFSQEIFNVCGEGKIVLDEVIKLLNKKIITKENSPKIIHNVSNEKLKEIISIPITRESVLSFIGRI